MVIYASACQDCGFTFENACDSTTHTVAERHARVRGHEVVFGSYAAEPDRSITSKAVAAARRALPLVLAGLILAGCAGGVFDNGGVIRNEHAQDPRFVAMVADLRPAMDRVADAREYRQFCIWGGSCRPILPRLLAGEVSRSLSDMAAGFSEGQNVIAINLRELGDRPQWFQRAVLAHELGHWVRWKGSRCHKDRVACEHGADAEAVNILSISWGIPHAEAVEQVHRTLLYIALSWVGQTPRSVGHQDPKATLEAFRATFKCTDTSGQTCTRTTTFELLKPGDLAPRIPR